MKVLDTDHCIEILRGRLNLDARISANQELGITSISIAELTHGARRSSRPEENLARLDVLLATLTIFSFDEFSARRFGLLKTELERAGNPLNDMDLQIACIVMENQATLVTHNGNHFGRLEGLNLEDWLA
jgi:tRNA(fMet)-specific endonuclease VapC